MENFQIIFRLCSQTFANNKIYGVILIKPESSWRKIQHFQVSNFIFKNKIAFRQIDYSYSLMITYEDSFHLLLISSRSQVLIEKKAKKSVLRL